MCDDAGAQDAPFVPTVTAISSTPDFQWMVQPTIITSVSPRLGGKQANEAQSSHQATPKEGGSKGKNAGKKGKTEQVGFRSGSRLPAIGRGSRRCNIYICQSGFFVCNSSIVHTPLVPRAGCEPSFGARFIFRSQQVCNNGLFLGALQRNMLLPFFKGCIGGGGSSSGDETAASFKAITELFPLHASCLQRRRRRRG